MDTRAIGSFKEIKKLHSSEITGIVTSQLGPTSKLWGPYDMGEGMRRGYLATSRQHCNTLLGVHQ